MFYSEKFDVVNSYEWANCIPEMGDGGPTITGRVAIHDPNTNELKFVERDVEIPNGWELGRPSYTRKQEAIDATAEWHRGRKRSELTRKRMRESIRKKRMTVQCEYCNKKITRQNIKRHIEKTHGK